MTKTTRNDKYEVGTMTFYQMRRVVAGQCFGYTLALTKRQMAERDEVAYAIWSARRRMRAEIAIAMREPLANA